MPKLQKLIVRNYKLLLELIVGDRMLINGVPINCITQAAHQYKMPVAIVVSVLEAENGRIGTARKNPNGTIDYGPMQINSIWLKQLKAFGYTAHDLQFDPCVNINVGTWILAQKIASNQAVWSGIGDYHSHSAFENLKYRYKVSIYYDALEQALTQ
jgi:hypothetical protein